MLFSYYKEGCSIYIEQPFLLLSNHIATSNIFTYLGQ